MAAVSGLVPPRHPSPFRKAQKISRSSATTTAHGPTSVRTPSKLEPDTFSHSCRRHRRARVEVTRTVLWTRANSQAVCSFRLPPFCVPGRPPSAPPSTTPTPRLDHFIAYALHQTQLHQSVTFAPSPSYLDTWLAVVSRHLRLCTFALSVLVLCSR